MRITDQHLWNIIFLLVFLAFLSYGGLILDTAGARSVASLTFFELALIALASFRFTRLMVYDKITAFFREQFYDVTEKTVGRKKETVLVKPDYGPRRTLADLVSCPWCFGIWSVTTVLFFYLLTPFSHFAIYILAIAAVATPLQLLANLIGWKAEALKQDVERL